MLIHKRVGKTLDPADWYLIYFVAIWISISIIFCQEQQKKVVNYDQFCQCFWEMWTGLPTRLGIHLPFGKCTFSSFIYFTKNESQDNQMIQKVILVSWSLKQLFRVLRVSFGVDIQYRRLKMGHRECFEVDVGMKMGQQAWYNYCLCVQMAQTFDSAS